MNIGRLFLDVRGTISCRSEDVVIEERKKAVALVKELIQIDQLDELIISIVSGESIETVEAYATVIMEIFKGCKKVRLGCQHADCVQKHIGGSLKPDFNNKLEQIIESLQTCEHSHCYYADDCEFNRRIAEVIIPKKLKT